MRPSFDSKHYVDRSIPFAIIFFAFGTKKHKLEELNEEKKYEVEKTLRLFVAMIF